MMTAAPGSSPADLPRLRRRREATGSIGRRLSVAIALLIAFGTVAHAQEVPTSTPEVFRRYSSAVVKLEVVEGGAAGRAELGSGFYVGGDGRVLTNYHVISKLVHDPERYRAELVDLAGSRRPVEVIGVDVVHDLAVLKTDHEPALFFTLAPVEIEQGLRLYSLGHPADLGLSIVEGTYNGLLEHTLYDRIHFTGSINPGMSGGPAITESGRVVGINVSTAGDQLSFLVPVQRALDLLETSAHPDDRAPESFIELVGEQIRDYQNLYLEPLFQSAPATVVIDGYRLPTQPAGFFNCWGDIASDDEQPFTIRVHNCTTDDYVYLSRDHSSGIVRFEHLVLTSEELNAFRFSALYSNEFSAAESYLFGREQDVTSFRCEASNVTNGTLKFRAQYCARRYKKYEGLYDVIFRLAALGQGRSGLISSLTLSGVSFENAQRIAADYLRSISWER